jgi:hypothetical protein
MTVTEISVGFDRGQNTTMVASYSSFDSALSEFSDSSMIWQCNDPQSITNILNTLSIGDEVADLPPMIVELHGRSYILGSFATRHGGKEASTDINNKNRYQETKTLASLLGFTAQLLKQIDPKTRQCKVSVVMSMPLTAYSVDKTEAITREFGGSKTFKFNGETYTFDITILKVQIEGTGGIIMEGVPEKEAITVVIDGGSGTTGLLKFRGPQPIASECHTINKGVNAIMEQVNALMDHDHGTKLDSFQMNHALRGYALIIQEHGDILNFATMNKEQVERFDRDVQTKMPPLYNEASKRVSAKDIFFSIRHAINDIGEQICGEIARHWGDDQGKVRLRAAYVLYIGGQPYYLKSVLRKLIPSITVPTQPEMVNARGNAIRALRMMMKTKEKTTQGVR